MHIHVLQTSRHIFRSQEMIQKVHTQYGIGLPLPLHSSFEHFLLSMVTNNGFMWYLVIIGQHKLSKFFYTTLLQCEKEAGTGLCIFTFTFISSLSCLHTFWHAISTSFTVCLLFLCIFVNLTTSGSGSKHQLEEPTTLNTRFAISYDVHTLVTGACKLESKSDSDHIPASTFFL